MSKNQKKNVKSTPSSKSKANKPLPTTKTIKPTGKFDLADKSKIDNNSKLVYNYYNTTIGSSDVEINKSGDLKYYTVNISYPLNTPNALYPDSLGTYNANKIYLSGVIHNNIKQIPTTNAVGELIIEHNALTGTGKLYVCILLNYSSNILSDKNSADDLIYVVTSDDKRKQVLLNSSIPTQQNAVVYTENGNKIIVFVSPIYISSNSNNNIKKLSTVQLFNTYSATYTVLPQNNISMAGNDDIYIDCSPTGASAEEIATYNVPINSEYTQDAGKLDFMKTTINLSLIFILILITYFSVPFLYKISIIDIIDKLIDGNKLLRNIAVDIILCFIAFIIFISLISNAAKTDNFENMLTAVYFIIFCLLSIAIITYNKTTGYFEHDWVKNITFQYDELFNEIIQFFGELGLFICKGPDENSNPSYKNIIRIFVLYIITVVILVILRYGSKSINKKQFSTSLGVMAPIIIFGVSMVALLNKAQNT
jgi:hypothetical protein